MSETSGRAKVEIADHVAVVTLTRADKHNALDAAMFEAIIGAAGRLRERARGARGRPAR